MGRSQKALVHPAAHGHFHPSTGCSFRVFCGVQEYGIRTVVVSNIEAEAAGVTVGDQYEWDEVRGAGIRI